MDKAGFGSKSAATTAYNTVFIGTNLETHLAMIVPDSDTVSDLKKKIVYEHTLCFPNIGEIKVHALKVKRRGCFYYLSDLMPVKSAFEGVSKSWFLFVDASTVKVQKEISHSCKPDSRNKAAHFDLTNNNFLADVVDLLPDGPSRRLSNIDDSLLLQVADKQHQEQIPIAERFGSRKVKKTGGNDRSLIDHGVSASDAGNWTSRQQEMTTPNCSLQENLEREMAILENIEPLGDNHRLTDTASGRKRKRKEQASNPSQIVGVISSEKEVEETIKLRRSIGEFEREDVSNTGVGSGESKNEAVDSEAEEMKEANMLVDQHASHVEEHSSPMIQEPSNLRESGVTGHENQTAGIEDGTVEIGKSLRKRNSRKAQGSDEETSAASGTEHPRESSTGIGNGESRSKAADLEALPAKDTIMLVDHVSHVEDHSSLMLQEQPRSLWGSMVTGHKNHSVVVEDETMEAGKPLRQKTKFRKAQGLDVETSIASGTEHLRESLGDVSPTELPISDEAEKSGSTQLKEATKIKMVSAISADDEGTNEVIQDVLESLHVWESLHQYSKYIANQDMDKESKKKTKKKRSSTLVENEQTKGKDILDHYNRKTSTDDVNLLAESSKGTRLVNTTSMNKLYRSKESQNDREVEGNCEVLPLQDVISVNCPAINFTNDENRGINVSCEDNRIKNQRQNEAVASSEKHVDKVTDKRAADSKAKATKKKRMLNLQSTGPSPNLQHSVKSNENHSSGGDAQVTSSEPIQNQRSSLKSVNESDRVMVQSNKKLPSISLSREKLPESNESEKLITPEEARTPIVTNSSKTRTQLKFSASTSSSLESCKSVVHKNKSSNAHQSHLPVRNDTREVADSSEQKRSLIATSGTVDERGNESQSHVAVRKAQSNNNGKVADSSDRKRSLLAMSRTIFKDDGEDSSDDEDKTDNPDASTRTSSDKSSSSESSDSDAYSNPSENGSYSSKGQGSGGRNKKSLPSSPRSMPLEAILRSSTRYKRAKLTFSQSHYNDTKSQPDEFVPDYQRK